MVTSSSPALLRLISPLYDDIFGHERDMGLRASNTDMRPRIDYFHDAVRALTNGTAYELTVPQLAYNLQVLNYITANPAYVLDGQPVGTTTTLPAIARPTGGRKYDPRLGHLSGLYRNYAVIYAGLFGDSAESQYRGEKEAYDAMAADLAQLSAQVKRGEVAPIHVGGLVEGMDDAALSKDVRAAAGRDGTVDALKNGIKRIDGKIAKLEQAHTRFLSAQMNIFQESKDLVQKLAVSGVNVAGSYVQGSADRTGPGRGR